MQTDSLSSRESRRIKADALKSAEQAKTICIAARRQTVADSPLFRWRALQRRRYAEEPCDFPDFTALEPLTKKPDFPSSPESSCSSHPFESLLPKGVTMYRAREMTPQPFDNRHKAG